ncbi:phage holin family protein [bacterium]|nr:phage holin family protein [bacterium]MDC1221073.1 phage holin family protein [Salibacteraceae bacterium]
MSRYILQLLIDAVAIVAAAYLLPGVDVKSFWIAILVAFSLSILNSIVKPIMVILTIPATILSLGLFLFVINALIILLADWVVDDFVVQGFWYALLFSLVLTFFKSILNSILKNEKQKDVQKSYQ